VTQARVQLAHIEVLRTRLTPARFDGYVESVGGDHHAALSLYEWNRKVSSSFHGALGQLEVLVSNALDVQLVKFHRKVLGGDGLWWKDISMPLQPDSAKSVSDARKRVTRAGVDETHGKVIAELMFGFWRFLLDAKHSPQLWAPALRHAFPHLRPKVRTEVYDRLEKLNNLRNRIAHYEPIHRTPLEQRWQDLLLVAGWICPTSAAWIDSGSTVTETLATRP
jgi:hypothetical protein